LRPRPTRGTRPRGPGPKEAASSWDAPGPAALQTGHPSGYAATAPTYHAPGFLSNIDAELVAYATNSASRGRAIFAKTGSRGRLFGQPVVQFGPQARGDASRVVRVRFGAGDPVDHDPSALLVVRSTGNAGEDVVAVQAVGPAHFLRRFGQGQPVGD